MSLFTPAGGLKYHLKAFRFRKSLWESFSLPLLTWLETWPTKSDSLLLIGPSAGYSLREEFLSKFKTIHAVDIDPLAPFIFGKRFPNLKVDWLKEDFFKPTKGKFDSAKLKVLLERFPDSAVLFCNILGQLPLLYPKAAETSSYVHWKTDLSKILAHREWASYHDRVSGPDAPLSLDSADPLSPKLNNFEMGTKFFEGHKGRLHLYDHMTEDLFPGYLRKYLPWNVTPQDFHIIEGVHHGMKGKS